MKKDLYLAYRLLSAKKIDLAAEVQVPLVGLHAQQAPPGGRVSRRASPDRVHGRSSVRAPRRRSTGKCAAGTGFVRPYRGSGWRPGRSHGVRGQEPGGRDVQGPRACGRVTELGVDSRALKRLVASRKGSTRWNLWGTRVNPVQCDSTLEAMPNELQQNRMR